MSDPVTPTLFSLHVGQPREMPGPEPWRSSILKEPVTGAILLARTNLEGDRQADLRVHGGPDKAVCVYSAGHYPAWRQELGEEECGPGWFGENFTVAGQSEETVSIGDVFRVGAALVQVAQPRGPCRKLANRWGRPEMVKIVVQTGRTGWYLRVLEEGYVRAGDPLVLAERPHARWTIAVVNKLTYAAGRRAERLRDERAELMACPALAENWRNNLRKAEQ